MPNKMSYAQLCRAEAAAIAYRTAIDIIRRNQHYHEAIRLLELKRAEKLAQVKIWKAQKDQERVIRGNKEYREANRDNDEL